MDSNQKLNAWNIIYFQFEILKFTDKLQTSKIKFSLTPYYSSSRDVTILLYESLLIEIYFKSMFFFDFLLILIDFFLKFWILIFFQFFNFSFFFSPPLSEVLTSIKSIATKFLLANTICVKNPFRKWTQIKNWTHGTSFIFNLKSLNLPISCRPQKSNFPWHRITLRVGM